MAEDTCDYVAKKDNPEKWNGHDSSEWGLDREKKRGGLGPDTDKWHCPHPSLEDGNCCIFHTDPEDYPEDINESEKLLEALDAAGESPYDDGVEHRGQFIGAIFSALDLSDETIVATDDYNVRFDHTVFQGDDADLNFEATTFLTEKNGTISFSNAIFATHGSGNINFSGARFRSAGDGNVIFSGARFRSAGDGNIDFVNVRFKSEGNGTLNFGSAKFDTKEDGGVNFRKARFEVEGDGQVYFRDARFKTEGDDWTDWQDAGVDFRYARFKTEGVGNVNFIMAKFKITGDNWLEFRDTRFETEGKGHVDFTKARFEPRKNSSVSFEKANFNAGIGKVDFGRARFEADEEAEVNFGEARFETRGNSEVTFGASHFETKGNSKVIFSGAKFKTKGNSDVAFGAVRFETKDNSKVSFSEATFEARGDSGAIFRMGKFRIDDNSKIGFEEATFVTGGNGNIDFRSSPLSETILEGSGILSFRGAEFDSVVRFDDVNINSVIELVFSGAVFKQKSKFGPSVGCPYIRGRLDFSDVTFVKEPNFIGDRQSVDHDNIDTQNEESYHAKFVDSIDFSDTEFSKGVDFSDFKFPDGANFDGADLSGANFSRANLSGVSFERATLNRTEFLGANLQGAHLYGALLGDARINHRTRFWPAYNEWAASDYTISLSDVLVPINSPVPDHTTVLNRIPLLGAGYANWKAWLRQGRIPYCRYDPRYDTIDDATLPGRAGDTSVSEADESEEAQLERAAEVYGTIESLARDNSLQELASEAFVGRKDAQRRQYWREDKFGRQWLMWLRSIVPNGIARYGESPWRVLGTGLFVVIASGLMYWAFDLIEQQGTDNPATLLENLYFSALTFTTLGYGDFRPTKIWGQALAVGETAIGVTMLAILVFVFGRRATR